MSHSEELFERVCGCNMRNSNLSHIEKKLGNCCVKVGSGITPKGGDKAYLKKGIPFIRSQNVYPDGLRLDDIVYISTEQHQKMVSTQLKPFDVLLNITGASIGRCCVVPQNLSDGNVNQHVCIIRCNDSLNPFYLSYFLNSSIGQKQINSFQAGGNRQGLNYEQIKRFNIPHFPIKEQKKIAEILSTWDRAIEMLDKLISAKTRLKKGLMQKLLTGKVRFKGYTNRFERALLGAIAKVNMGQSPSSAFYNTSAMGLPLIQGNADCKNRLTFPTTYTSEITKKAYIDDIIMSVRAPVGSIAKCTLESCIGRGVCSIRGDKIDNDYLYQFLLFCEPSWTSYAQGSTFTAVNGNDIRKLEVSFPSEQGERKKIARILSSVDRELDCLTHIQEKLKSQKQGLMQKLLTGKIRVKI